MEYPREPPLRYPQLKLPCVIRAASPVSGTRKAVAFAGFRSSGRLAACAGCYRTPTEVAVPFPSWRRTAHESDHRKAFFGCHVSFEPRVPPCSFFLNNNNHAGVLALLDNGLPVSFSKKNETDGRLRHGGMGPPGVSEHPVLFAPTPPCARRGGGSFGKRARAATGYPAYNNARALFSPAVGAGEEELVAHRYNQTHYSTPHPSNCFPTIRQPPRHHATPLHLAAPPAPSLCCYPAVFRCANGGRGHSLLRNTMTRRHP